MRDSDAIRACAVLFAYFPRKDASDIPPETLKLWAKEIVPYDLGDALEASETLGTMGRFMPSLAEFVDTIRDCRNARMVRDQKALPRGQTEFGNITFGEWLRTVATEKEKAIAARCLPSSFRREFGQEIADAEGVGL